MALHKRQRVRAHARSSLQAMTRVDDDLLARAWPETHVILGLFVSKRVRLTLQSHADRVIIGGRSVPRFKDYGSEVRLLTWIAEPLKSDVGLVQFRRPRVEVEIRGKLFLENVFRVLTTANRLGWQGSVVFCNVTYLCGPFCPQSDLKRLQLLRACTNVRRLCLCFRRGGANFSMESIAEAVISCPQLTDLDVRSTPYITMLSANQTNILAHALASSPHLQRFKFTQFALAEDGAASMAKALEQCTALTSLSLGQNKIIGSRLSPLLTALRFCRRLERLGLYGHHLTAEGYEQLAVNMAHHWPGTTFKLLNLSGNRLDAAKAPHLSAALTHCPGLQHLDLRGTGMGRFPAVTRSLSGLAHLVHLDVAHNTIGGSVVVLCEGLAGSKHLAYLDLSFNLIRAEGAAAVAALLPQLPQLRYLNVFHNDLGDAGMAALAGVTGPCPRLEYVDVRRNRISNLGARLLGNLVRNSPALHTVDMTKNTFRGKRWVLVLSGARPSPALLNQHGAHLLAGAFARCGAGTHKRGGRGGCWRVVFSSERGVEVLSCQGRRCMRALEWDILRRTLFETPQV